MIPYVKGVYCLTSPSGKRYVGIGMSQRGVEGRWNTYKRMGATVRGQSALYSALLKYGANNFKYEVVLATNDSARAAALERQLIAFWNLTDPSRGYNIAPGGLPPKGYSHPKLSEEEFRLKLSQANKEAWERRKAAGRGSNKLSEHSLARRRAHCKRRDKLVFTEDALRRIRESATGRPSKLKGSSLPAAILERRLGPDGKLLPEVAAKYKASYELNRERNSQILKDAWVKRRAEGKVPGPLSEAAKDKLRAWNKARAPEIAARQKAYAKLHPATPEYRAKCAEEIKHRRRDSRGLLVGPDGVSCSMTPEQRARQIARSQEALRACRQDPAWLAKKAARAAKRRSERTAEERARRSEISRAMWVNRRASAPPKPPVPPEVLASRRQKHTQYMREYHARKKADKLSKGVNQ